MLLIRKDFLEVYINYVAFYSLFFLLSSWEEQIIPEDGKKGFLFRKTHKWKIVDWKLIIDERSYKLDGKKMLRRKYCCGNGMYAPQLAELFVRQQIGFLPDFSFGLGQQIWFVDIYRARTHSKSFLDNSFHSNSSIATTATISTTIYSRVTAVKS